MPRLDRPRILILGCESSPELCEVRAALAALAPSADVKHVATVSAVARLIEREAWFADLALVVQQWPDEYSTGAVGELLTLLPLARWICCYGPWCASDGRTRNIWPLAARVPASCAAARIRLELAVLKDEQPPLPLTAARDEVFEFETRELNPATPPQSPTGAVVISGDAAFRRYLLDVLRPLPAIDDQVPSAAIWDVDPWSTTLAERIRRFRVDHPTTALVALTALTDSQHWTALQGCGAYSIVLKLAPLAELSRQLRAAIMQPQTDRHSP